MGVKGRKISSSIQTFPWTLFLQKTPPSSLLHPPHIPLIPIITGINGNKPHSGQSMSLCSSHSTFCAFTFLLFQGRIHKKTPENQESSCRYPSFPREIPALFFLDKIKHFQASGLRLSSSPDVGTRRLQQVPVFVWPPSSRCWPRNPPLESSPGGKQGMGMDWDESKLGVGPERKGMCLQSCF